MNLPPLLSSITHPFDVSKLNGKQKTALAAELRKVIVSTVAQTGGHLAPSLGVVELTIALLSIFNPDQDKIIWDVGHQSYAWKLLTGRARQFDTLRSLGGLSGFCKPAESPYDHFGVGHSSTSISAALGMAMARDLHGDKYHIVAVLGDGSLTGGMAFEGLNQAGAMERRLIVVLNDNEMSISHNVGALSLFLSRHLSESWARGIHREVSDLLRSIPSVGEDIATYAERLRRGLKIVFTPGMLFEAFNFNYIGPVNGHDLPALERHLRMAASVDDQPVLLHVLTTKGKGYAPAEADPARFHGIGKFNVKTGASIPAATPTPPSYTKVFSETICELAEHNPRIVVITAAMPEGTGTEAFHKKFPDRFVDVGICEQHAVTFAAGLASQGYRPFVAIYSTFLQRAYDQILHDVCLQNLPVTLCIDRAGLVGEDGPTHHGVFDLSYLRHMPHMRIAVPRDEAMLRRMLAGSLLLDGPTAIRYPRGSAIGVPLPDIAGKDFVPPVPGKGEYLLRGQDIAIIAVGSVVHPALEAARAWNQESGHGITVYDARWVKPLPDQDIIDLAHSHKALLLAEENVLAGGFSSGILEMLANHCTCKPDVYRMGIDDTFIEQGPQKALRHLIGLDSEGIGQKIREIWKRLSPDAR